MTRLPLLRALARSFVLYCTRVTAAWLMDQLAERQRADEPYSLANDPWIGVGGATYQFGER